MLYTVLPAHGWSGHSQGSHFRLGEPRRVSFLMSTEPTGTHKALPAPGIELATFQSLIQRLSTAPP